MIKLVELLKENGEYPPYMYSPIGFGCHVCKYYYVENDKQSLLKDIKILKSIASKKNEMAQATFSPPIRSRKGSKSNI